MQKRFITADEAISLLPEKEYIHTFYNTPPVLCGADWDKQEVIDKLKAADKIEIAGETARNMDHGLAVYNNDIKMQSEVLFVETDPDKLNAFDNPDDKEEVEIEGRKQIKTVTIEDCERLRDAFHDYAETAERHEFMMLGLVDSKLQQTIERYREAGEVTNQQEARTMCRVVLRVIGEDYSEYKEERYERE